LKGASLAIGRALRISFRARRLISLNVHKSLEYDILARNVVVAALGIVYGAEVETSKALAAVRCRGAMYVQRVG
jgi:hypothetical protein